MKNLIVIMMVMVMVVKMTSDVIDPFSDDGSDRVDDVSETRSASENSSDIRKTSVGSVAVDVDRVRALAVVLVDLTDVSKGRLEIVRLDLELVSLDLVFENFRARRFEWL